MTESSIKKISRKGMTVRELAEQTGLSTNTIIRHTSQPWGEYRARAKERDQKILELREQGMTMRAIAEELDIGLATVHRAVKSAA